MISTSSTRAASKQCLLLLLALLFSTSGVVANPQDLVDQGQRAFQNGAFSEAATDWKKAAETFRSQGNTNAEIQTSLLLATAYQAIGQQRRAVQILEEVLAHAESAGDRSRINLVKSKLGAALLLTLDTDRSASLLREALETARADKDSRLTAAVLNDLGNLLATEQKHTEALTAYGESVALARQTTDTRLTAQALCNGAATAARAREFQKADDLNTQGLQTIAVLGDSYQKAFLFLTAGQTDRQIKYSAF